MAMDVASEIKKIVIEVKRIASKENKISAFVIQNTANIKNRKMFFLPIRNTPHAVCGSANVYSSDDVRKLTRAIDGIVDVIFVDVEEKTFRFNNTLKLVKSNVKKSKVLGIKINDLTVEAADSLISQMTDVYGKKIAIIGSGNLGSKLALKLVERGANVFVTRLPREGIEKVAEGLNLIKPKNTNSKIIPLTDNHKAAEKTDILIGFSPGIPVIDEKMVNSMNSNGIIIDGGLGTVFPEAIKLANKKNIRVIRLDMRPGFSGALLTVLEAEKFLKKVMGEKKIKGIRVVAGGIIGREGDVVVDDISHPTKVFGVADGKGFLMQDPLPSKYKKNLYTVKATIEK